MIPIRSARRRWREEEFQALAQGPGAGLSAWHYSDLSGVVMALSLRIQAFLEKLGISAEAVLSRGLQEYPEPGTIVFVEREPEGREHWLAPAAAAAWRALRRAAEADGVPLFIVSSYRSVERQIELMTEKQAEGESLDAILKVLAPPGFSEHHTGMAVDVGSPDSEPVEVEFETTAAFRWLQQHAGRFGFVMSYPAGNASGYQYEPWHWRFRDT